jgi:DNA repair protein RecO (recombination protein O)
MAILRSDAISLRAIDWSETSQIAWFFTRDHGRVHVVAKGSKRPRGQFQGALEPLVRGEVVFYRKARSGEDALDTLKEFDARDAYPGLRRDLGRLYRGTYVIEVLRELSVADEPLPELFDAAVETLDALARGEASDLDARLFVFELRALRAAGLEPSLDRCAECGSPASDAGEKTVAFGPLSGGVLCAEHRSADTRALRVSLGALRTLAALAPRDGRGSRGKLAISREVAREARAVLDAFFAHRIGRELRLARHVLQEVKC